MKKKHNEDLKEKKLTKSKSKQKKKKRNKNHATKITKETIRTKLRNHCPKVKIPSYKNTRAPTVKTIESGNTQAVTHTHTGLVFRFRMSE